MATPRPPRILWTPSNPTKTQLYQLARHIERRYNTSLPDYHSLHTWSVEHIPAFWSEVFDVANFIHEGTHTSVVDLSKRMDSNPSWFAGVKLNHAENLLYTRPPNSPPGTVSKLHKEDSKVAITEVREGGRELRHVTWGELRTLVGRVANALRAAGVARGDRVAAIASNSAKTIVLFLATSSLGAVFTSSATDMGVKGVMERLVQVRPKWVFCDDWAVWNGKKVNLRGNIKEMWKKLEGAVEELKGFVVVPRFEEKEEGIAGIPKIITWSEFLKQAPNDDLTFIRVDFNDPVGILYSSGTTGAPKCIVHRVGGVLVNAYKDQTLLSDFRPDDTLLQFTTTGWVMFYYCINILLDGGRSVLYDGSPFKPTPLEFIRLIADQKVTHLGISPRYLLELFNHNIRPRDHVDLRYLRHVTSTGMVLSENLFEWFYDYAFPTNVQLANITGGTDIATTFAGGNPLSPVYAGGFQGLSLGMKVEVFDSGVGGEEGGNPVKGRVVEEGEPGELVCTKPFPSMPISFFGPGGQKKYFESYFARYDDVWHHGDFISIHPTTHTLHVLGRSDGVLNPSGIRFGSSEIYSILEVPPLSTYISDSLLIGQRRPSKNDPDEILTMVRQAIAKNLSKRHVPHYIFPTPMPVELGGGLPPRGWVPVTINGKKTEAPVKKLLCYGVPAGGPKVAATVTNRECIEWYGQFFEREEVIRRGGPTMPEGEGVVKARL
ncbi:hypothetical protein BDZ91DRAFT_798693 [Kalaharituber pfeilii]|nr:hypothetical protein BDZ91DRAFT_798693 [Kalaharituber pfeilii]